MKKNKIMNLLIFLSNSTFIKTLFGGVFTFSTFSLVQQAQINNQGLLEAMSSSIPSQAMSILGIISGIIFVLGYASKEWKKHKMNMTDISIHNMKIKEAIEHVEREEILTEKDREELRKIKEQL